MDTSKFDIWLKRLSVLLLACAVTGCSTVDIDEDGDPRLLEPGGLIDSDSDYRD